MTIALFSVSTPHHHYQTHFLKQKNSWPPSIYLPSSSKIRIVPPNLCSPPSTPAYELAAVPDSSQYHTANQSSFSGCKACGREEIEKGCNGEGRVQGGIATVPGFSWWPIKAYRPCPGFLASGGRYRRQGQSIDEVVSGSGRAKTTPSSETAT